MTRSRSHVRPGRRALAVAIALMLAAVPAITFGHAELVSTTPAAGAVLPARPTEVALAFDGELSPDGSAFTVTDAIGTIVGAGDLDLTVADRNELRGPVTIDELGTYTVAWTAVSADGHAEHGEFAFDYAAPLPGRPSPDTAAPGWEQGEAGVGVSAVGVLALIAAVAAAMRSRRTDRS